MAKLKINGKDELLALSGQEVALSDWFVVTQELITGFAELTGSMQWIHLDVERCQRELPDQAPLAHGLLVLSLLPQIRQQTFDFPDSRMNMNYGYDKVRFTGPVPAGSRIRAGYRLSRCERKGDSEVITQWTITTWRDGVEKPVLVAEFLLRFIF